MQCTITKPPLLGNPDGVRRFILAWDSARLNDNSVILVAELINDEKIGWRMELANIYSLVDVATKGKTPLRLPEQVERFKDILLAYNGNDFGKLDYENIEVVLMDAGAGGQIIGGASDYLLANWERDGVVHRGMIDPLHKANETARNAYPDAIRNVQLVDPKGNRNDLFKAIEDLLKLDGVIKLPAIYDGKDYLNMNINNFVIDRAVRGTMFSTTDGKALWSINQVEEPSLKVTVDTKDALDALGTPIMTFERGKKAQFTASNSLFDLALAAAQFGSAKQVATSQNKLTVPKFEEITLNAGYTTVTLSEVPVGTAAAEITYIYGLNGDETLGTAYALAATADATHFALDAATKALTPPTGLVAGTRLMVMYNYASAEAVAVYNSAKDFPAAGRFVLEVLGCDVCDITQKYRAYIIFPQAKLLSEVDIGFSTDSKHPFTIEAMQQYCDKTKKLFEIVVPDGDDA